MKFDLLNYRLAVAVALLSAIPFQASKAEVLLNLVNAPSQFNTSYYISFIAAGSFTTISMAGYQIPSVEEATNNGLFLGGGGDNLLGATWKFTPAATGSGAYAFDDQTSVAGLMFAASTPGSYDVFSQKIATIKGESYALEFLYMNADANSPSGFRVSADVSTVPEPATWGMMLAGFAGIGLSLRARRKTAAQAGPSLG